MSKFRKELRKSLSNVKVSFRAFTKSFRMLTKQDIKNKIKQVDGTLYRHKDGDMILKTKDHKNDEYIYIPFVLNAQVITQKHKHGQNFEKPAWKIL